MAKILTQIITSLSLITLARSASITPPVILNQTNNELDMTPCHTNSDLTLGQPPNPSCWSYAGYTVVFRNYRRPSIPYASAQALIDQADLYLESIEFGDPQYHGPLSWLPGQRFRYYSETLQCHIFAVPALGMPMGTVTYRLVETIILGAKRLVRAWGKENDIPSTTIDVFAKGETDPKDVLAGGELTIMTYCQPGGAGGG